MEMSTEVVCNVYFYVNRTLLPSSDSDVTRSLRSADLGAKAQNHLFSVETCKMVPGTSTVSVEKG